MSSKTLIEGIDYNLDKNGQIVMTKSYHLKRGHCCQSGCLNCPYGYSEKVNPNIPQELNDAWADEDSDYKDEFEIYE